MIRFIAKSQLASLQYRSVFGVYIEMRDHDKKINPAGNRVPYSFRDPATFFPGAPSSKKFKSTLRSKARHDLEKAIFEEYKRKLLLGTIDKQTEKRVDELWGEGPKPFHYYKNLSRLQLMTVSHPQTNDVKLEVDALHAQSFKSTLPKQEITFELIQNADVHQLVEISLLARSQKLLDRALWYEIEKKYDRGNLLYLLSPRQILNLKYALEGQQKFGTPVFHKIISDLLTEDIGKFNKDELVLLFFACRYSNAGGTNLQLKVLEQLDRFFDSMSVEERMEFYFMYATCTNSLRKSSVEKRYRFQYRFHAHKVLFKLQLDELSLNHDNCLRMVYALAKMRVKDTRHLTSQLRDHIVNNLEDFISDSQRLYKAIVYLPELEGGIGIFEKDLYEKFRTAAVAKWQEFQPVQKIRILHSFWNFKMFNAQLKQLYKGIQIESDSTLLFYFTQIQMSFSSEREWKIIHQIAKLSLIPLPYFYAYKRFYNYIKKTTKWNLTPIADKLTNTENQYDVLRYSQKFYNVKTFAKLKEFQQFSEIGLMKSIIPIENTEVAMFGFPQHQISFDIVNEVDLIPGTNLLKQTYQNKLRSLVWLNWVHIVYNEKDLEKLQPLQIVSALREINQERIDRQKVKMAEVDKKRSQEIDRLKMWQGIKNLEPFKREVFINQITNGMTRSIEEIKANILEQSTQILAKFDEYDDTKPQQKQITEAAEAAEE